MVHDDQQAVRRSSRIKTKKEASVLPNKVASSATGLKTHAKTKTKGSCKASSRKGFSLNEDSCVSLNAHHVSVLHCSPFAYIPTMSKNVEAGFDAILGFKDALLNRAIAGGQCRPVDIALDGISNSILRELLSVLRPESSTDHKNMDSLSFLTTDNSATPFLWALNRWDESTTCPLMRSIQKETHNNINSGMVPEDVLENISELPETKFLVSDIVADAIAALTNVGTLQAGPEMVHYITQLTASVQRIYHDSEVSNKEKLLWISIIRLLLVSLTVTLNFHRPLYSMLGVFLSKNTLNTTMSLVLGEHTRMGNYIDYVLLDSAVKGTATEVDYKGQYQWVRVLNENALDVFNEVITMPTYNVGFGGIRGIFPRECI